MSLQIHKTAHNYIHNDILSQYARKNHLKNNTNYGHGQIVGDFLLSLGLNVKNQTKRKNVFSAPQSMSWLVALSKATELVFSLRLACSHKNARAKSRKYADLFVCGQLVFFLLYGTETCRARLCRATHIHARSLRIAHAHIRSDRSVPFSAVPVFRLRLCAAETYFLCLCFVCVVRCRSVGSHLLVSADVGLCSCACECVGNVCITKTGTTPDMIGYGPLWLCIA